VPPKAEAPREAGMLIVSIYKYIYFMKNNLNCYYYHTGAHKGNGGGLGLKGYPP